MKASIAGTFAHHTTTRCGSGLNDVTRLPRKVKIQETTCLVTSGDSASVRSVGGQRSSVGSVSTSAILARPELGKEVCGDDLAKQRVRLLVEALRRCGDARCLEPSGLRPVDVERSEEHTSELQSLMRKS